MANHHSLLVYQIGNPRRAGGQLLDGGVNGVVRRADVDSTDDRAGEDASFAKYRGGNQNDLCAVLGRNHIAKNGGCRTAQLLQKRRVWQRFPLRQQRPRNSCDHPSLVIHLYDSGGKVNQCIGGLLKRPLPRFSGRILKCHPVAQRLKNVCVALYPSRYGNRRKVCHLLVPFQHQLGRVILKGKDDRPQRDG